MYNVHVVHDFNKGTNYEKHLFLNYPCQVNQGRTQDLSEGGGARFFKEPKNL